MLGMILPPEVESEERFGDAPGGVLFPEEEKIVAPGEHRRARAHFYNNFLENICVR